ncbi:hypothetical protein HG273_001789 [Campylobacter coli]|nr:hypothetical protein [Campylobacter coli]EFD4863588.1 hypothetical protein [Campylobacter coli]
MKNSVCHRIELLKNESLGQNLSFDINKQFDFISLECNRKGIDEDKLRKDIIKENFFEFIGGVKGFFADFLVSIFCLFLSMFAIILTAFVSNEELFLTYCLIAGFFWFIGIWAFQSNLNALKYYANIYAKEFIRKRIFG